MQEHIERVTDSEDLTVEEAEAVATAVFEDATEAQIGALLAALRAKGETEAEIAGFAKGMRAASSAPICASVASSKTAVATASASSTVRSSLSVTRSMYSFIVDINELFWPVTYKCVHVFKLSGRTTPRRGAGFESLNWSAPEFSAAKGFVV